MVKHEEQLSVGNEYAKRWVEQSGLADGDVSVSTSSGCELGLATCLYFACRDAFKFLCQSSVSEPNDNRSLKQQLGRFYLWGESYVDGSLDNAIAQSDEMRDTILNLLCDIAGELLQPSFLHRGKLPAPIEDTCVSKLSILVEKAKAVTDPSHIENDKEVNEEASSVDESTISCFETSDSESEADPRARSIKYLTAYIQGLMDLGPMIEINLIESERRPDDAQQPALPAFDVSEPARTYVSVVRDKFPKAPTRLVERLGEANWQRHVQVRKRITDPGEKTFKERIPVSVFHDSGIGSTMPSGSQYAATTFTRSSFNSSMAEKEYGSLRVPPTPKEVSLGQPFQCFLCQVTQRKIKNRVDWKKHVYKDLQPYICTHSGCQDELLRFSTREAWAQHFDIHRLESIWRCTECDRDFTAVTSLEEHLNYDHAFSASSYQVKAAPLASIRRQTRPIEQEICALCLESPGKNRRKFIRHVCRHMEDIALMVLPRDLGKEGNEEEESDDGWRVESESSVEPSSIIAQTPDNPSADTPGLDSVSVSGHTSDIENPLEGSEVVGKPLNQENNEGHLPFVARVQKPAQAVGKPVHQCKECDKIFKRLCDLTKHQKTHKRPWKCSEKSCKYHVYGWPTEKERDRHVNDKHSPNPTMYKCQFRPCPYESKRESNCKQHMEKTHGWSYVQSKKNYKGLSSGRSISPHPESSLFVDEALGLSAPPGSPVSTKQAENSLIKCICGFYQDDGNIILCESCLTWQHIQCYFSRQSQDFDVSKIKHQCVDCDPNPLHFEHGRDSSSAYVPGASVHALAHQFSQAVPKEDGVFHSPWQSFDDYSREPEKSNYNDDKNLDSNYGPYMCLKPNCSPSGFSSYAALERHRREAHWSNGDNHLCPFKDCERSLSPNGFSHLSKLDDHLMEVHARINSAV